MRSAHDQVASIADATLRDRLLIAAWRGEPMDRPNLHVYAADQALRTRARAVIPGGMYGHQNAGRLPDAFRRFPEYLASVGVEV